MRARSLNAINQCVLKDKSISYRMSFNENTQTPSPGKVHQNPVKGSPISKQKPDSSTSQVFYFDLSILGTPAESPQNGSF